jgi:hypothetical protein
VVHAVRNQPQAPQAGREPCGAGAIGATNKGEGGQAGQLAQRREQKRLLGVGGRQRQRRQARQAAAGQAGGEYQGQIAVQARECDGGQLWAVPGVGKGDTDSGEG